jgi:hypothetical protein
MARTLICPTAILLSHKVLGHTKLYLEKAPVCWNPSMCMLNCLEGNRKLMDMILELGVDYSSNFWFRLLFQRSHNSQSQGFPSASVFTSHWSSSHAHPDFPVTPDLTHPMVQSQALVKSLWLPLTQAFQFPWDTVNYFTLAKWRSALTGLIFWVQILVHWTSARSPKSVWLPLWIASKALTMRFRVPDLHLPVPPSWAS